MLQMECLEEVVDLQVWLLLVKLMSESYHVSVMSDSHEKLFDELNTWNVVPFLG
jgi:hypothetical protein